MCMSNINPAQRRYSYKMMTEIAENIDGAPIVKCVRAVITRAIDYTKKNYEFNYCLRSFKKN